MSTGHDRFPAIFLPGILMPARLRYQPLLEELGDSVQPIVKELEVYAGDAPPDGYSIQTEVDGINRVADAAGLERFHLYGHSAGGAIALAYAAAHPERVLTLAIDEPASDFSPQYRNEFAIELARVRALPESEQMAAFMAWQLAPGVELPPPPGGPKPEWMGTRPAGIRAFTDAVMNADVPIENLAMFEAPVYYSYGSLSNPLWQDMRDRLSGVFPVFSAELYEGIHHLNTSHQSDPARVAERLRRLWTRAKPTT
jgi:pimeloyl-ACP methyl ester carboxylesterase